MTTPTPPPAELLADARAKRGLPDYARPAPAEPAPADGAAPATPVGHAAPSPAVSPPSGRPQGVRLSSRDVAAVRFTVRRMVGAAPTVANRTVQAALVERYGLHVDLTTIAYHRRALGLPARRRGAQKGAPRGRIEPLTVDQAA